MSSYWKTVIKIKIGHTRTDSIQFVEVEEKSSFLVLTVFFLLACCAGLACKMINFRFVFASCHQRSSCHFRRILQSVLRSRSIFSFSSRSAHHFHRIIRNYYKNCVCLSVCLTVSPSVSSNLFFRDLLRCVFLLLCSAVFFTT